MAEIRTTKILAARVDPWIKYKVDRFAKTYGNPMNSIMTAAVNSLINKETIPERTLDRWLRDYHRGAKNAPRMD